MQKLKKIIELLTRNTTKYITELNVLINYSVIKSVFSERTQTEMKNVDGKLDWEQRLKKSMTTNKNPKPEVKRWNLYG